MYARKKCTKLLGVALPLILRKLGPGVLGCSVYLRPLTLQTSLLFLSNHELRKLLLPFIIGLVMRNGCHQGSLSCLWASFLYRLACLDFQNGARHAYKYKSLFLSLCTSECLLGFLSIHCFVNCESRLRFSIVYFYTHCLI